MKERPILFSAPMVRAILAGSKTQTRRVVKALHPDCHESFIRKDDGLFGWRDQFGRFMQAFPCPYGQPGERLWVREAWRPNWAVEHGHVVEFSADNAIRCFNGCCNGLEVVQPGYDWLTAHYDCYKKPWRPSIHMPRWASRILLEITAVRVERLNEISEADARAEGVTLPTRTCTMYDGIWRDEYRLLWESINGAGSWSANPWVWVVEFRRVAP